MGIWRKGEAVDPGEHCCLAIPVDLALHTATAVDVLPVGRLGLEIGIHLLLLFKMPDSGLAHVCCSQMFSLGGLKLPIISDIPPLPLFAATLPELASPPDPARIGRPRSGRRYAPK